MKILVGLGNPGAEFEHTYHNAGRMALRSIFNGQFPIFKPYRHLFEYAVSDDMAIIFPLTYMNDSGRAVREALKKFKAKPGDLVVFHDDSDITIGDYKISFARNSGGHNGVQSIIDVLGTKEFSRVRIGIRQKVEAKRKKAGEFALKKISAKDQAILEKVFSLLVVKSN